jgi:hypothetical protein
MRRFHVELFVRHPILRLDDNAYALGLDPVHPLRSPVFVDGAPEKA